MNLPRLDISYKWDRVIFVFLWLACFIWHNIYKFHPHCSRCPNFISFRCGIYAEFPFPLYGCTVSSLSTPQLVGMWGVSVFRLLWITRLWTWVCKYLFKSLFSVLWGIYPRKGTVILCLTVGGTTTLLSTGAVREGQSLRTLAKAWYFQSCCSSPS